MKKVLKSVAFCTSLCIAVHNECSAMSQEVIDEIRRGELQKNTVTSSSSKPPASSSAVGAPRLIADDAPETKTPRGKLPSDISVNNTQPNTQKSKALDVGAANIASALSALRKVEIQPGTNKPPTPGVEAAAKKGSPIKSNKDAKSKEHKEQFRFVGGQRVVTNPGKKP